MQSGADLRGRSPLVSFKFNHVIDPHFVTFSNNLYTTVSNRIPNPNPNTIRNPNPNQQQYALPWSNAYCEYLCRSVKFNYCKINNDKVLIN